MVKTVYQLVQNMKDSYSDKIAIRYFDEGKKEVREISYLQYYRDIVRCASFLSAELGEGTHLAILSKNSYRYLVHIFAAILAGIVVVPINLQKDLKEVCYELDHADVAAIVHDGSYLEREPELQERFEGKFLEICSFEKACGDYELKESDRDSLSMIMFTSGTTEKSKGVMLSQKNLLAPIGDFTFCITAAMRELKTREDKFDSFLVIPMFHVAAVCTAFVWASIGFAVNLCLEMGRFGRDYAMMHGEHIMSVPVLTDYIYKEVMKGSHYFDGLRVLVSGAAMADYTILENLRKSGIMVTQAYGLTETFGSGTKNISCDMENFCSIGVPSLGLEGKIIRGELCLRGDAVMLGYYKDPEATNQAIDSEGWFHTGDLARSGKDGYIFLTGRKKNLIILSSGENVSPEELETVISDNPIILEAIVKEKDGKICAELFCTEGTEEQVREWITACNRKLPLYKRITVLEFRKEPFERTGTGKIKRK